MSPSGQGLEYAICFSCVWYEETKRLSRWQCGTTLASCVIPTRMLTQNAATILKLLVVQHVADRVTPFPRIRHSPPPTLKFFHTPPSPPILFPSLTCTTVRVNHHHHDYANIGSNGIKSAEGGGSTLPQN